MYNDYGRGPVRDYPRDDYGPRGYDDRGPYGPPRGYDPYGPPRGYYNSPPDITRASGASAFFSAWLVPLSLFSATARAWWSFWWNRGPGKIAVGIYVAVALIGMFTMGASPATGLAINGISVLVYPAVAAWLTSQRPDLRDGYGPRGYDQRDSYGPPRGYDDRDYRPGPPPPPPRGYDDRSYGPDPRERERETYGPPRGYDDRSYSGGGYDERPAEPPRDYPREDQRSTSGPSWDQV